MATPAQWLAGARPRTLPAAVSPVVAGTGVAAYVDAAVWWKALLALVVSLALQVAVNYANDYSDGIRGTDSDRVGPMRLVGSGVAPPAAVKRAAFIAFGVAGVAGLVLAASAGWWLVAVGAVSVLAAWFYTGGSRPYGYLGLGEVMVFVFFGLVAVVGTTYVQTETFDADSLLPSLYAAVGVGALACAILVVNNLRDIPTDTVAGKRTLAVVLGDDRTRALYLLLVLAAAVACVAVAAATTWVALTGLGFLVPAATGVRAVRSGAVGPALIPVLQSTGLAELAWAVLVAVPLVLAADGSPGRAVGSVHDPVPHHPGGRDRGDRRVATPGAAAGEAARPVRVADRPAAQPPALAPYSASSLAFRSSKAAVARAARCSTRRASASRCPLSRK